MKPYYESNGVSLYLGDCREIMPTLDLVHAIICDPPYELGFMGKSWDSRRIANDVKMWRVLACSQARAHLLLAGAVPITAWPVRLKMRGLRSGTRSCGFMGAASPKA